MEIRPGMSVNIVTHVDTGNEITDVRNALVYDVEGTKIILSQTSPPLTKYYVGKEITVTYLIKKKENLSRVGFTGKINTILNDYRLYSMKTVQALSVTRQSALSRSDIRMHYRVKPRSDSGISLFFGNERASLIDISIGGARFCHAKDNPVGTGTIIQIVLALDDQTFNVDAKAVKVWHPYDAPRRSDLEYVSVRFLKLDKICSHVLSGKILAMERTHLSKSL